MPQGLAHSVFIVVVGGRIDIAVTAGHGLTHGQRQLRPRGLVAAEAETGHIRTVIQPHCGGNTFDHINSHRAVLSRRAGCVAWRRDAAGDIDCGTYVFNIPRPGASGKSRRAASQGRRIGIALTAPISGFMKLSLPLS